MEWLLRFWRSTVGAKVVMAITGVVLYGFAIGHMAGNLNVFLGRESMNDYGAMLHAIPELLWVARLTLLGCLVLHIASFLRVQAQTSAARPVAYKTRVNRASTLYSRTMRVSGVIFLAYLVLHLLQLTTGTLHPNFQMQEGGHAPLAYENLVAQLSVGWVGVVYAICNVLLGFHLWHGSFSLFKTLGLHGEKHLRLARSVSWALSTAVAGGNVAIALAILTGLVK